MSGVVPSGVDTTELTEYLAIPYVAVVYSVERAEGEWVRRAEYPELPDCAAEARTAAEAMDRLEQRKVEIIAAALAHGEALPRPRPPLPSGACGLSAETVASVIRRASTDRS